ncbi:MAG: ComEC family competence protein, partial [Bacteroidales bacterium]|nr:ComEC family competence protein [Bacteroidales bacterium]
MFDLKRAPVARLLGPFAAGSLMGYQLSHSIHFRDVILGCIMLWIIMAVLFHFLKNGSAVLQGLFSTMTFILFLVAGYGTGRSVKPEDPGLPLDQDVVIRGDIVEDPIFRKQKLVFEMKLHLVVSADSNYVSRTLLKVYMEMPVDSILPADSLVPLAGETWQFTGRLGAIKNSGNPGQPDYESIMRRKNCWYRFFVDGKQSQVVGEQSLNGPVRQMKSQKINASIIRNFVSGWWTGDAAEVSLLKAVCLGDRSGLTDDMRQSYAAAGGMHLLAVSGLHVGLIWWVLHQSMAWMVRLFRRELFRALTIVFLLWFYAFLTGFSSSVCRSVTMFTFFTAARLIEQRSHSINGILVSAFVLILINPGRILDVGFQLSYTAIIGIVTLQPALVSLIKVKNRFLKWAWEATGVSLAAQLSTAPLVVYYFHQLPAYSLVTNLVAIPLLSVLVALFMFSIPFMAAGILAVEINWLMSGLAGIMNRTMEFVSSIPGSVIGNLYLDKPSLGLYMMMVVLITMILYDRTRLSRYLFLLLLSLSLAWSSLSRYQTAGTSELVVAHFNGGSLVTFREGFQLDHYQWCRDAEILIYMERYLELAWGERRFRNTIYPLTGNDPVSGTISGCIPLGKGMWLLGNNVSRGLTINGSINQITMESLPDIQGDFILISGEPRFTLPAKSLAYSGSDWIIDGSNRTWFRNRLD